MQSPNSHEEKSHEEKVKEVEEAEEICLITEKSIVKLTGVCSATGSCHTERGSFYGSSCQWEQRKEGSICHIEKELLNEQRGICSPGGHCKGENGALRLHHEACTSKRGIEDTDRLASVKMFLRKQTRPKQSLLDQIHKNKTEIMETKMPQECRGLYNPSAYKRLELICSDCYNLFKETEIYSFCMTGCFDSPVFFTCVRRLMLEEDMVMELVRMVGK